ANAKEDGGENHRKLYPEEHVQLPSFGPCQSAFARPRSGSSSTSGGGGLGLRPFTNPSQRSPHPLPVSRYARGVGTRICKSYSVVRDERNAVRATGHHSARDHHRRRHHRLLREGASCCAW